MAQGLSDDAGETAVIMRGAGLVKLAGIGAPESTSSACAGISSQSGKSTVTDSINVPAQSGAVVEISLKSLMESDDPASNVAVHPGDIVKVSRAGVVYVIGAITLAQGFTRTSAKNHARIIRTDQETNQRTEISLDLGKILANKVADPSLQARDILYIPDSTAKNVMYRGAEAAVSTATGVAIYRW